MTNEILILVVTAYCNSGPHGCVKCCGKWAPLNRTASGTKPTPGRTVAGPRSIPFGTVVDIPGIGRRIVEDRFAVGFDRPGHFEVFMASHSKAKQFGIRKYADKTKRVVMVGPMSSRIKTGP